MYIEKKEIFKPLKCVNNHMINKYFNINKINIDAGLFIYFLCVYIYMSY